MCKIAICDDDKEYREKIKTVIKHKNGRDSVFE